ncbi:MAG TPA: GIY-YIG nuclease family protein [Chitinophagaceae bacterium]|nr:GIY-YIG nuclease family protein [Chitinophagaceae bacterium]
MLVKLFACMYIVYALVSNTKNWIYVGFSADLTDRIGRHQLGYEKTTAPFRPFAVVELACAFNRIEARRLEKWYKTAYGKKAIRSMLFTPFPGGDTSLSANR